MNDFNRETAVLKGMLSTSPRQLNKESANRARISQNIHAALDSMDRNPALLADSTELEPKILQLLLREKTYGAPNGEMICMAYDRLDQPSREFFAESFHSALASLLEGTPKSPIQRDKGLDAAIHVLFHLQKNGTLDASLLRNTCQKWLSRHREDWLRPDDRKTVTDGKKDRHARGSVLRILRLVGDDDTVFWLDEYHLWIKKLQEEPEMFQENSQLLMQSVRMLGTLEALDFNDIGRLMRFGVRASKFPAQETYVALCEYWKQNSSIDPIKIQKAYDSIVELSKKAVAQGHAPDQLPANMEQMQRTIRSWGRNYLKLKI